MAASRQFVSFVLFFGEDVFCFSAISTSRENLKQVRGKQETRTCKLGCHLDSEGGGWGVVVRESGGGESKQIGRRG